MDNNKSFFSDLNQEIIDFLPMNFEYIEELGSSPVKMTFIENNYYGTKMYICDGFIKPLSKCFKI